MKLYANCALPVEPTGRVVIEGGLHAGRRGVHVRGDITLEERVTVSYNVTIADCDFHRRRTTHSRRGANAPEGDRCQRPALVSRPVVIGDEVWVGIGAIILKGVTIGRGARIGPGAVVASNVPAGACFAGNPARLVGPEGWLDG